MKAFVHPFLKIENLILKILRIILALKLKKFSNNLQTPCICMNIPLYVSIIIN